MGIVHFIQGGGWIMYPLLALSLVAGVVIVERLIAFSQLGGTAPGLLERVIRLCREGQFDAALQECRARSGPVATCLGVALEHRNRPQSTIEGWIEEAGQEHFVRLERYLPVLDTTTTISPLLGLLGTIVGMIGAFNSIAAQSAAKQGSSDAVLAGVAEALYATATGITIAVICFIAYNYFAARLRTVTGETEMATTKLLNVLGELGVIGGAESAREVHLNGSGRVAAGTSAAGAREDIHAVQTAA